MCKARKEMGEIRRVSLERGGIKTETRVTPTVRGVGGERRVREEMARERCEKRPNGTPCHKVSRNGLAGLEDRTRGQSRRGKLQQQGLRLDMKLPRTFQ